MKRLLAIFITVIMLVSLIACGENGKGDSDKNGDVKNVSAFKVGDGMIQTWKLTFDGEDTIMSMIRAYLDEDTSCTITREQIYYFEKSEDVYVIKKMIMKQYVEGENADEYINSLDPEEYSMEIAMLEEGGLVLDDEMMEEMGITKGTTYAFTYDLKKGSLNSIVIDSTSYGRSEYEFIFDGSGKQTGAREKYNDGEEGYEVSYTVTEFHSNGMPKTVEWKFGDDQTRTDTYTDKGFMER